MYLVTNSLFMQMTLSFSTVVTEVVAWRVTKRP